MTTRILSIDGGGIRGLIPAVVLAEIEERAGEPAAELFDWMTGVSTGAILGCGLAVPGQDGKPRHSAADAADFYTEDEDRIFQKSFLSDAWGLVDESYENEDLEEVLRERFGGATMSDALMDVVVLTYDIEHREPYLFSTRAVRRGEQRDLPLWRIALASSLPPTYFEPHRLMDSGGLDRTLIDGGAYAQNPSTTGLATLVDSGESDPATLLDDTVMVSLGTGSPTTSYTWEDYEDENVVSWMRTTVKCGLDGSADIADRNSRMMLGDRDYWRLQTPLDEASEEMDGVSEENLADLWTEGEEIIDEYDDEIGEIVGLLSEG